MTIKERFYHVYQAIPDRIPHVEGVKDLAVHWAQHMGLDPSGLEAAAYYHDLTKYEPRAFHIDVFETHHRLPWKALPEFMMHGYSASLMAQADGLSAPLVNAIKYHTTGRAKMRLEEKILMLADKVEPSRPYPEAAPIRTLAETDFETAFRRMLAHLYAYDIKHDRLNPYSLETYTYYLKERMAE